MKYNSPPPPKYQGRTVSLYTKILVAASFYWFIVRWLISLM